MRGGGRARRLSPLFPERTGNALLEREEIRAMVAELQRRRALEDRLARIRAGYERLAFGSIADAVRLLLRRRFPAALEEMDLFSVSEIKRPREGAMEIKFFNRLEALDRLRECDRLPGKAASPSTARAGTGGAGAGERFGMHGEGRTLDPSAVFSKAAAGAVLVVPGEVPCGEKDAVICDGAVRSGKTLCMGISFVAWAFTPFRTPPSPCAARPSARSSAICCCRCCRCSGNWALTAG